MHIAFDGGCFQQGLLGGIYQVARGFLNAAKVIRPDLEITLVCDPRQGEVRDEALAGLSWLPAIVYSPVAASYDPPEMPITTRDPQLRFFVDGEIVPATLRDGIAIYSGRRPSRAFAILSRAAIRAGDALSLRRGVQVERLTISGCDTTEPILRIDGSDRRLVAGFLDEAGPRWTDGAGFVPIAFFSGASADVEVAVAYAAQDEYVMPPGAGTAAIHRLRRNHDAAERERALSQLAETLRKRDCTAYFANHFTPIHLPGLINVAWAYDLIPILLPQYFHADARLNFDENLRIFAAADRVYAISESTRDDLIANTPVTERQVIAAGIAASSDFSRRSATSVARVLARYGLRESGYIIAVATIEPRKNHMRMLMAYIELRRRMPNPPELLFVGKMGWDFEQLLTLRADSGLEHSVKILSDVSDEELASLYSGAMFSAYLSVYEGFGLPIVEAMAAGCPVLTSDRSSMAEVAANAALTTNPYDIDAIANAFQRLCRDAPLRRRLGQKGLAHANHYSWPRSSGIILDDLARLQGCG